MRGKKILSATQCWKRIIIQAYIYRWPVSQMCPCARTLCNEYAGVGVCRCEKCENDSMYYARIPVTHKTLSSMQKPVRFSSSSSSSFFFF